MTVILGLTAFGLLCLLVLACSRAAATGDLMAENMALANANDNLAAALVESQEEAEQNAAAARYSNDTARGLAAERDHLQQQLAAAYMCLDLVLNDHDLAPVWPVRAATRPADLVVLPAATLADAIGGSR